MADLASLFVRLMAAHSAPGGSKPTEDQLNEICRQSGAVIAGILHAVNAAAKACQERAH